MCKHTEKQWVYSRFCISLLLCIYNINSLEKSLHKANIWSVRVFNNKNFSTSAIKMLSAMYALFLLDNSEKPSLNK